MADNLLDYLPYKILCIKLRLLKLVSCKNIYVYLSVMSLLFVALFADFVRNILSRIIFVLMVYSCNKLNSLKQTTYSESNNIYLAIYLTNPFFF